MEHATNILLANAKAGEESSRRVLIEQYRSFILRAVCNVCKRSLGWEADEASIGLIAFNEAIDRYNEAYGKSFESFALMHMRNRLVDEFRRNSKYQAHEQLVMDYAEDYDASAAEINSSLERYQEEQTAQELAMELMLYDQRLQEYGIDLEELEACSPNHRDTRANLIGLAKSCVAYAEVVHQLQRLKRLPIQELQQISGLSRKTIERNRKYLIALILIFSSEEFRHIRQSVSFVEVGE